METEKICANCKHCIIDQVPYLAWTKYSFKCKKSVLSCDHITGDRVYGSCCAKNMNGQCEDYERQTTKFEDFINKFTLSNLKFVR